MWPSNASSPPKIRHPKTRRLIGSVPDTPLLCSSRHRRLSSQHDARVSTPHCPRRDTLLHGRDELPPTDLDRPGGVGFPADRISGRARPPPLRDRRHRHSPGPFALSPDPAAGRHAAGWHASDEVRPCSVCRVLHGLPLRVRPCHPPRSRAASRTCSLPAAAPRRRAARHAASAASAACQGSRPSLSDELFATVQTVPVPFAPPYGVRIRRALCSADVLVHDLPARRAETHRRVCATVIQIGAPAATRHCRLFLSIHGERRIGLRQSR